MAALFESDWRAAHTSHGLRDTIEKLHGVPLSVHDVDGNGVHDEVDAVKAVLHHYYATLHGAFDYYTALCEPPPSKRDARSELDLFNMTHGAWLELVRDCKLVHGACAMTDVVFTWQKCNADDRDVAHAPPPSLVRRSAFARYQFLSAVVCLALVTRDHPHTASPRLQSFPDPRLLPPSLLRLPRPPAPSHAFPCLPTPSRATFSGAPRPHYVL
jgi:hypothetical protein